eukprot:CAMPEP_0179076442 /NCGR_PEP_ID=MMETSP0796-20121207/34103_1 /TAXON_ID=73915 /ORGANISM="Pyrodinium bahamense, Strain pbaha01" /LENGTH=82 /DNA_ID=CAMNT_0020773695 /DNA_START=188 /DNA_END=436 /DNA_ORIENTATION=-
MRHAVTQHAALRSIGQRSSGVPTLRACGARRCSGGPCEKGGGAPARKALVRPARGASGVWAHTAQEDCACRAGPWGRSGRLG